MPDAAPNERLRNWRQQADLTRAEMAKKVNLTKSEIKYRLSCDEERIRRWKPESSPGPASHTGSL
jgi:transcriptional regulator with XRE-family HTH domain